MPRLVLNSQQKQILKLTNKLRKSLGLSILVPHLKLTNCIQGYVAEIASTQHFSHTSLSGSTPFSRASSRGIRYNLLAENLCGGQETPAQAIRAWVNSSGHYANLIHPKWQYIGVGFVYAPNNPEYMNTIYGQMFMV